MNFIDSHAHLSGEQTWEKVDELLERAKLAGIVKIINICTDQESLEKGVLLREKYDWIFNTAATTPHDVEKEGESLFPLMEKHAREGKLVAIGETGLDYHYEHSPRDLQKKYFIKYLQLALECDLPVVIHCREAFTDFFEIIDKEYKGNPGVLHCFTGTVEEAKGVINRGWYLSLSGIVTFKKSLELQEVAKIVPLDQLLIETDTPYLAPQGHRGKPNEPSFIIETAKFIAHLKNIPIEELVAATSNNALNLFKLGELKK